MPCSLALLSETYVDQTADKDDCVSVILCAFVFFGPLLHCLQSSSLRPVRMQLQCLQESPAGWVLMSCIAPVPPLNLSGLIHCLQMLKWKWQSSGIALSDSFEWSEWLFWSGWTSPDDNNSGSFFSVSVPWNWKKSSNSVNLERRRQQCCFNGGFSSI